MHCPFCDDPHDRLLFIDAGVYECHDCKAILVAQLNVLRCNHCAKWFRLDAPTPHDSVPRVAATSRHLFCSDKCQEQELALWFKAISDGKRGIDVG